MNVIVKSLTELFVAMITRILFVPLVQINMFLEVAFLRKAPAAIKCADIWLFSGVTSQMLKELVQTGDHLVASDSRVQSLKTCALAQK